MQRDGVAWVLETPGKPLEKRARRWTSPTQGFALVEVWGCGVCHTDLGFADGSVRPRQPVPLVLGHEIVGRVLAAATQDENALLGKLVVAPAVSPCGQCASCRRGRVTSCANGRMPGNDADGGFATYTYLPARDLLVLGEPSSTTLGRAQLVPWQLAPTADAASTAWQALARAGVSRGEVAIFVGAGGVGTFGAELAATLGAHPIALDVDERRLSALSGRVMYATCVRGKESRQIREELRAALRAHGLEDAVVRVFETSGQPAGQSLAFQLLERGGSLSIVGFTPEKVSVRLSNVMALDADVYGNWGCDPALLAPVIERVLDGRVLVAPHVSSHPLDDVNEVLGALGAHRLDKRAVLIPPRRDP